MRKHDFLPRGLFCFNAFQPFFNLFTAQFSTVQSGWRGAHVSWVILGTAPWRRQQQNGARKCNENVNETEAVCVQMAGNLYRK